MEISVHVSHEWAVSSYQCGTLPREESAEHVLEATVQAGEKFAFDCVITVSYCGSF